MPEPTTLTTACIICVGLISILFPGINEPILLGAFCGSIVFVMSSISLEWWAKIIYAFFSLFLGLWGADTFAKIISGFLIGLPALIHIKVDLAVNPAIGALFCSAIVVHILLFLTRLDWAKVFPLPFKGGS